LNKPWLDTEKPPSGCGGFPEVVGDIKAPGPFSWGRRGGGRAGDFLD